MISFCFYLSTVNNSTFYSQRQKNGLFPSGSLHVESGSYSYRSISYNVGSVIDGEQYSKQELPYSDSGRNKNAGGSDKSLGRAVSIIEFNHTVTRSPGKWVPIHKRKQHKV